MRIVHNRPYITREDRAAVDRVLESGWIAQGKEVALLEKRFSNLYRGGEACAVSSGTSALFLALKGVGVKAGMKVAVPTYACSALLNAVYHAEATPLLIDVQSDTFCMNPNYPALSDADIVIVVNTYGARADVSAIRRPGQKVIEDCCHSLGSMRSSELDEGDVAIFSFYATKLITGGQGGLVWSRRNEIIATIRDYRQFDCRESYKPRFNFQMTDVQAALVNSQLLRLQQIRKRRQEIAEKYLLALPNGLEAQAQVVSNDSMAYRFTVCAPDEGIRDALKIHLANKGVETAVPIEKYELLHRYLHLPAQDFPVAERLANITLSLPIHAALTDAQVEHIAQSIRSFNL